MKGITGLNPRRLAVASLLLLLVTSTLLFWARDVVREVIVLPISYWIYALQVFFQTTPQVYFWLVLLTLAVVIAYRSLAGPRRAGEPLAGFANLTGSSPSQGRVAYWNFRLRMLRLSGNFYQSSFQSAFAYLLRDLVAYRYHIDPNQVEDRLRNHELDVPPEVRDYLLSGPERFEGRSRSVLAGWWEALIEKIRRLAGGPPQEIGIDPRVVPIIEFMEKELEVSHDDSDH